MNEAQRNELIPPIGSALRAAREISDYLIVGFNHNTPDAQWEIAKIIDRYFEPNNKVEHPGSTDNEQHEAVNRDCSH